MTEGQPDQPQPVNASSRAVPTRVIVAGVIWAIFGIAELAVGISGLRGGAQSDTTNTSAGSLGNGGDAGPADATTAAALVPIVLGVAILAFAVLLLFRKWWARLGVAFAGTIAVVDLAVRGQSMAFVAMALLVVAVVPTMSATTHRFLYGSPAT